MNTHGKIYRLPQGLLAVLFLLVGCSPLATSAPVDPNVSLQTDTPTPKPLATTTSKPTEQSILELKHNLDTPTVTPIPTLSSENAKKLVLELIADNGGCEYPCWWGITPGETLWADAHNFLSSFAKSISYDGDYHEYVMVLPDWDDIRLHFADFRVEDQVVDVIHLGNPLSVSETLGQFGKPSQIWLSIGSDGPIIAQGFYLTLFYQGRGIMKNFVGYPIVNDALITICPNTISEYGGPIWLWSPKRARSFQDIAKPHLRGYLLETHFLLDEVTDIGVDYFYDTYVDPSNAAVCFDMPNPYWKPPKPDPS
ncbi:MAG: hypothetical protein OEZ02_12655 [Anaerolineae bacterium]|nr:hypothetical protein [Anaerolineae bacterium]